MAIFVGSPLRKGERRSLEPAGLANKLWFGQDDLFLELAGSFAKVLKVISERLIHGT
jgi:hypothetical protein